MALGLRQIRRFLRKQLAKAIDEAFGSMDEMKAEFGTTAAGVFGSGWAWLGCTPDGKLAITATPNQGEGEAPTEKEKDLVGGGHVLSRSCATSESSR